MASYTAQSPAVAPPKRFLVSIRDHGAKLGPNTSYKSIHKDSINQNSIYDADRRSTLEEPQTSVGAIPGAKSLGFRPPRPSKGSNLLDSQRSVQKVSSSSQTLRNLLSQRSGILSSRGSSLKLTAAAGDLPIDSVDEGPGRKTGRNDPRVSSIPKCTMVENSPGLNSNQQILEFSSRTHQTPSMYATGKELANKSMNLSKYVLQTPPIDKSAKALKQAPNTFADMREEAISASKPSHQSSHISLKSPNKELLSGISDKSCRSAVVYPWKRQQPAEPGIRTEDIMNAFVADL
jgi:hypothetical protein